MSDPVDRSASAPIQPEIAPLSKRTISLLLITLSSFALVAVAALSVTVAVLLSDNRKLEEQNRLEDLRAQCRTVYAVAEGVAGLNADKAVLGVVITGFGGGNTEQVLADAQQAQAAVDAAVRERLRTEAVCNRAGLTPSTVGD